MVRRRLSPQSVLVTGSLLLSSAALIGCGGTTIYQGNLKIAGQLPAPAAPADTDGDGVPDAEDACPNKAGVRNANPKLNGCPPLTLKRVMLKNNRIEISEKIQFEINSHQILPVSHGLLGEIVQLLDANKQVKHVRIEGHASQDGPDDFNQRLSARRADAVKKFLVAQGVDESRLEAKGFGETKPIEPDESKPGAAEKNRRVEFHVVTEEASK